jgi:hypothetical protein
MYLNGGLSRTKVARGRHAGGEHNVNCTPLVAARVPLSFCASTLTLFMNLRYF